VVEWWRIGGVEWCRGGEVEWWRVEGWSGEWGEIEQESWLAAAAGWQHAIALYVR